MNFEPISSQSRKAGSTLIITLLSVLIVSLIAGHVIASMSARYQSAARSAAWNEALVTAEAGVDMTVAEVTRLLPDLRINSQEGLGLGFSQPSLNLLTGLSLSPTGLLTDGTLLTFSPPPLKTEGEVGGSRQAKVSLDVLPLANLLQDGLGGLLGNTLNTVTGVLNGQNLQLLRIRSSGTVPIPGSRRAGLSKVENELWRPSLVWDRSTGKKAPQPTVTREIEVILRPVFPFEGAVASLGSFEAPHLGNAFDSFNSALPLFSTNGEYDASKRLTNGTVLSNTANFVINGVIHGNAGTNGGNLVKDSRIIGQVDNNTFVPMPFLKTPTWNGNPLAPNSVPFAAILPAGTAILPARYKFSSVDGHLRITKGLLGLNTHVEIHITGDFRGTLELDPGVNAKVWVGGDFIAGPGKVKNGTRRAANLQIYGVPTDTGDLPEIKIDTTGGVYAAIYAPGHNIELAGNGDLYGSISGNKFTALGASKVHYDEALALNLGPLLRYEIASWVEITK